MASIWVVVQALILNDIRDAYLVTRVLCRYTMVSIHCSIWGSSGGNHGSGAVLARTSGQLLMICPNSLTLHPRIRQIESLTS